jgi:hypothetical protein
MNNLADDPVNPLKGKRRGFGSIVETCTNGGIGFKDSAEGSRENEDRRT